MVECDDGEVGRGCQFFLGVGDRNAASGSDRHDFFSPGQPKSSLANNQAWQCTGNQGSSDRRPGFTETHVVREDAAWPRCNKGRSRDLMFEQRFREGSYPYDGFPLPECKIIRIREGILKNTKLGQQRDRISNLIKHGGRYGPSPGGISIPSQTCARPPFYYLPLRANWSSL